MRMKSEKSIQHLNKVYKLVDPIRFDDDDDDDDNYYNEKNAN